MESSGRRAGTLPGPERESSLKLDRIGQKADASDPYCRPRVGPLIKDIALLRHIVLVSFKPEATADQIAAWHAAVTDMCETRSEIFSFSLGKNIGSGPNHHDAALVPDFEHIDAFRRYVGGNKHKAYVWDHARHVTARLAAFQHEM
jgi:hypothetical protein